MSMMVSCRYNRAVLRLNYQYTGTLYANYHGTYRHGGAVGHRCAPLSNRKAINLRTVLGAWIIQVGIGALILYVPAGRTALLAMSNGVANVIAYGNEGIGFIFGGLVSDKCLKSSAAAGLFLPCASCRSSSSSRR
jgi:hypothetical protein